MQPVGVVILLRDHALIGQLVEPVEGDVRQVLIAARLLQAGFGLLHRRVGLLHSSLRLQDLLIELGRFDFRQYLAGGDAVANIGDALLHIAAGAGEHGRLGDGLNVTRKNQAVGGG